METKCVYSELESEVLYITWKNLRLQKAKINLLLSELYFNKGAKLLNAP
jgi:hypothetical protein